MAVKERDPVRMRFPVIAFDLDGTLLPGTTTSLVLAHSMNHLPQVEELERQYRDYEIDNIEFATQEAALFCGVRLDEINAHLRTTPWIGGVTETLSELAGNGHALLLATLAWRFAAEELEHRPWFEAVSGAGMTAPDGVLSGEVNRHLDEEGKLAFVADWCAANGYTLADVAAIGDSRSDVPLFQATGLSIALNATAEAKEVAKHTLDTEDLRDVLPLLR
jgi:phosphoserine phosphatase